MRLGFWEIVVILIVALVVIGPEKLPSAAGKLGEALRSFRRASGEVKQDILDNVMEPFHDEMKSPPEKAAQEDKPEGGNVCDSEP